jgi:SNF2 family DNA or RNA helicase
MQPVASDTPLRTCFRLDPPDDDQQEWRVSFHLQASEDPSLLIPAEKVWQARSGVITFLKHRFGNPQEHLLAGLGKASRIFPTIEESLKTACPVEVNLGTESAYLFLRQSAPLLEQSGFGVLLPAWWQKSTGRLSARLNLKPKAETKKLSPGLLGMDAIVTYDWEIALGDESLSPQEFEKLANLKVPLVKVRGQWVELEPEEIERAIAFFQTRASQGEMKLSEAMRIGLGQEVSELGLPVTGVESQGWIGEFWDKLCGDVAQMPAVEPPQSFKGQLRPYQIKGLSWLTFLKQFGLGACLADDMGLGKTIEFIALMLYLQEKRLLHGPTLLICPMSVVSNWEREAERFAPSLKVMVHHGPDRASGEIFERESKRHDLVITTYALAHHDEELLSKVNWECVALDEAQNIKNPSAKQTQAIRKLNANYRVALTGTPVENRLSELWSIMEFLNPSYLRSAKDFYTNFVIPIEKFRSPSHTERLKRLIQPFVLRRVKTDPAIIDDLPEKVETKVFCNLTREQATLYEAVVKEMLEKIENSEGIERKGLVLSTLLKLKQVCNHPAQFLQDRSLLPRRSGKLIRLEEMLEETLAEGDKALIFTQFAEMGKLLQQRLQETFACEALFLHGSTTKRERDAMIQRFQQDHRGAPLFVLSLKAGGLGLNLTAANHVFHFDRWWNPAVENQATDRVFRIGQKKNVQVHKLVCLGTVEEHIDEMIEQKKELAQSIIGTGEAWLTEMSTEQLREVFALSHEAVGEE